MEIAEEEETHLLNTAEIGKGIDALKSMLQTLPPLRIDGCIYRVPYELRRVNEEAYTPMLVSIGPFHHGTRSLQKMEVHKLRYLNDLLKRRGLKLEDYLSSHPKFEETARNCYAENIDISSENFITMMLLDGCFVVEFCLKYWSIFKLGKDDNGDPIFKSTVMSAGILRDMALLENQLPFSILVHLFNTYVEIEFQRENSFHKIALNIMNDLKSPSAEKLSPDENTCKAKHMVDLCLQYYTPTRQNSLPETERGNSHIPNASRLRDSGVKFTKCTSTSVKCLLDVIFINGNLEIPMVEFHDNTETFLRNLIAYEQCYNKGNTQYFTEYIHLMNCLIDTPNDVEFLKKAGIIINLLGDNGEVAQIFNKLSSGVKFNEERFYLRGLFKDVNDYSNKRRHTWRAKLMRNYFDNPWRSLSVLAAVSLLLLTITQTVFSILQFCSE